MGHAGAIGARRSKQWPQDGPKMDPRGVWGAPRAAHGLPRGPLGAPRRAQEGPEGTQESAKRGPRGVQKRSGRPKMGKAKMLKKPFVFIAFLPPGRARMTPKGDNFGQF